MARGVFPCGLLRKHLSVHQARFSYLHMRYLFFSWLAVFVGSWIVYVKYSSYTELCRGHDCKNSICDKYRRGVVDGSACSSLCEKGTLVLGKCFTATPSSQVYSGTWGDLEGVIKCQMEDGPSDVAGERESRREAAAFNQPTKGTSVEKFREMIVTHLKATVGDQSNLAELATRVLGSADANKDRRISLPEARATWALLQLNEFLLAVVLQDKGHTPRLLGFCGDLYVMEKVPSSPLYGLRLPWLLEALVPAGLRRSMDQWFTPSWPHRAKISIGLLELVEDVFHGSAGSFLMCDVSAASFGHSEQHDFRLTDAQHVVPEAVFRRSIRQRHCNADRDCLYGADCFTSCDLTKHRCTPEVSRPNLAKACRTLQDYILRGAPADVSGELEKQLDACMALTGSAEHMEMEHSLVLNNLKTLLWNKISHNKDS
ncbi:divergent protein kinase domain 1A-like [Cololabis saira]|uniref:divergent protein kinase domain 1A-like n=1 Tax=Cololabis saira TaxID=129043 RepID=UPI002AD31EE8|nr:divergent protein kinase domain 1A-like [Cololabis saira]